MARLAKTSRTAPFVKDYRMDSAATPRVTANRQRRRFCAPSERIKSNIKRLASLFFDKNTQTVVCVWESAKTPACRASWGPSAMSRGIVVVSLSTAGFDQT